jgi:membrane-bound serine protease (ClpP class)
VGMGGKEIDETMAKKVTNDMVAYVKSIAEKRHRNIEWAEKAVTEAVSVPESEALKNNIIDLIAEDIDDLVSKLEGRKIEGKGEINLKGASRHLFEESLRAKILKIISDPNIAYILLMIGMAGLYFELSHPGAIFPGVVGAIALILAFYALQTLPVNYAGLLLILLAIFLFIMEMKITSFGLLSIGGVISLVLGSIMLFRSGIPGLQLDWQVFIPTVVFISGFFVTIAALVFRAQLRRPLTGASGLVGEIGVVKQKIAPEGKVFVHGELWQAFSKEVITESKKVRIVKVENLVLEVEPI